MTNAETITKLNGALQTLIKAYEELQDKNNNLKERVAELEDEVLNLELSKEGLEKRLQVSKQIQNKTKQIFTQCLERLKIF